MILMSKRYAEGCRKKAAETADPARKAEERKGKASRSQSWEAEFGGVRGERERKETVTMASRKRY